MIEFFNAYDLKADAILAIFPYIICITFVHKAINKKPHKPLKYFERFMVL